MSGMISSGRLYLLGRGGDRMTANFFLLKRDGINKFFVWSRYIKSGTTHWQVGPFVSYCPFFFLPIGIFGPALATHRGGPCARLNPFVFCLALSTGGRRPPQVSIAARPRLPSSPPVSIATRRSHRSMCGARRRSPQLVPSPNFLDLVVPHLSSRISVARSPPHGTPALELGP